MNLRKPILLAVPVALGLVASAHAAPPAKAPKPLVLTDQTGDANLISNQGLLPADIPAQKTDPASASQFDIKSLTVTATGAMAKRRVGRKTVSYFNCTGYAVTLELAGAPLTTGSLYRVKGSTPAHATYWLEYSNDLDAVTRTTLRYTDDSATLGTSSIPIAPAKVDGNKILFVVTGSNMKAVGEAMGKTVISGWGADTRNSLKVMGGGGTIPQWDDLPVDTAKAWKVCPV